MALDRDRDPLRQVPAPGEDAADQRVVDAELLAFFAQALLGSARDGVEVDLVARVQAGDDEPADVVQQRGHGKFVALGPADDAADLVGRALGRQGVDAEALGLQLPAAVGLEEVEAGRGAGDRQHAGGLEDVDRRRGCWPTPPAARPLRFAKRSTVIASATSASTASTSIADPRSLGGRGLRSPARATRAGPGSARPPQRLRPGGCRGRPAALAPFVPVGTAGVPLAAPFAAAGDAPFAGSSLVRTTLPLPLRWIVVALIGTTIGR